MVDNVALAAGSIGHSVAGRIVVAPDMALAKPELPAGMIAEAKSSIEMLFDLDEVLLLALCTHALQQ